MKAKYHYAGFITRASAHLLDLLLFKALTLPILLLLRWHVLPLFLIETDEVHSLYYIVEFALTDMIAAVAIIAMWVKKGASPGQILMEIRVVDFETGDNLSWLNAALRFVLLVLAVASIVGVLWILIDRRQQGIHDKLLNTVVIENQTEDLDDALRYLEPGQ